LALIFSNSKLQVEGRGNGIKTAIPNMLQLANSLHRDPGEVTKFFGTELGAQTTWTAETERAIVNGAHTTQDLQNNLFKYVEKFVLCPGCRLPETVYKIKSETIFSVCAACGAKEPVDMTHKLTVFIVAQDKKRKKEKKDAEKKDDKEAKKKGDKKKKVRFSNIFVPSLFFTLLTLFAAVLSCFQASCR
jgi:translation initiation factor 5